MGEFEIAVVSKVGKAFCAACYDIEGEYPLILSAYINVFKSIEWCINSLNNNQEGDVIDI